ncbi:MAG: MIP/aquaporin family protein [Alphaproteobacteria bacterium]|jgi:glycerol uptake facilitator-like aquaporin
MNSYDLNRRLAAEALGTLLLVATVVGSGIMGERLAGGNDAIALLGNTIATGAILVVLILIFGPVSGAHFNPAVSIALAARGIFPKNEIAPYIVVQVIGGIAGTIVAHYMFEEAAVTLSTKVRAGPSQWAGEIVATFGLLATILGCLRYRADAIPFAVGLYISAGYWFTSSTSFANPAVAIARGFTDSFSGIRPADVPMFVVAQIVGALLAAWFFRWLHAGDRDS